jgi:hypothetical protein
MSPFQLECEFWINSFELSPHQVLRGYAEHMAKCHHYMDRWQPRAALDLADRSRVNSDIGRYLGRGDVQDIAHPA